MKILRSIEEIEKPQLLDASGVMLQQFKSVSISKWDDGSIDVNTTPSFIDNTFALDRYTVPNPPELYLKDTTGQLRLKVRIIGGLIEPDYGVNCENSKEAFHSDEA